MEVELNEIELKKQTLDWFMGCTGLKTLGSGIYFENVEFQYFLHLFTAKSSIFQATSSMTSSIPKFDEFLQKLKPQRQYLQWRKLLTAIQKHKLRFTKIERDWAIRAFGCLVMFRDWSKALLKIRNDWSLFIFFFATGKCDDGKISFSTYSSRNSFILFSPGFSHLLEIFTM